MNITVSKDQFNISQIRAISSKSMVHRLLIAAACSEEETFIRTNIFSDDMKSTAGVLMKMGASISIEKEGFRITKPVRFTDNLEIDCMESGSTARFLLPLSILFSDRVIMTGHGALPSRPFKDLNDALRANGAEIDEDHLPISASGSLHAGKYVVPGNVSSQFISGLLFLLPLLQNDSRIQIVGKCESKDYINMTLEVLAKAGIKVERREDGFEVYGNQEYRLKGDITAPGDWSNAAYILCMGAFLDSVTVNGLEFSSLQGDKAIVDVLKDFGTEVNVNEVEGKMSVSPGKLKGITLDVSNIPDLVPALSIVASAADEDTVFKHVERLRIKESDRVVAIQQLLKAIGIESETVKDNEGENLIIHGKSSPCIGSKAITVDGFNDHRIVMAAAIAALKVDVPITIDGAQAVNKSYPGFFEEILCHLQ